MKISMTIKQTGRIENILPKNWLSAKHWEEVSCGKHESHIWVKIAHLDPIPLGNQEFIRPRTIQESETHQTIIVGSEKPGVPGSWERGQRAGEEMIETYAKAAGDVKLMRMAGEMKKQRLEIEKGMREHGTLAPVPERFDYHGFITIAEQTDEKMAKQTLENYRLMAQGPLDVPVPGMNIPGMSDKTTMREIFKSDLMKNYMTEEQIKAAEKAMEEMQKEVKEKFPKDVKIQKGKYQGCDVVFLTGKSQATSPSQLKESKDKNKIFHSARVGRFIVSGTLLRRVNIFPLGSSSCDSLTRFKTKTKVTRIGGKTFVDKEIRPVESTLAKEGYLYKEEVDKIFSSIFSYIKK